MYQDNAVDINLGASQKPSPDKLEKVTYFILGALSFLMPFFLLPTGLFPLQMGKGLLLSICTILALVIYLISLIKTGRFNIPKNLFSLSILLLPVVALISNLFNGASTIGLLGFIFDVNTVVFIFLSTVFLFLVSEVFQSKERIFFTYIMFFVSFAIVALYQLIRLMVGPEFLSFGVITTSISNLLGNWSELGVFFGVSTILSLITLEMLELKKVFKWLIYAVYFSSLAFLAIVNFSTMWFVLGVFALIFFIYIVSFDRFAPSMEFANNVVVDGRELKGKAYERKISYNSLILLVVSLVFVIAGSNIGNKLAPALNVVSVEVRPSWSSTFAVMKDTLKSSPLVGSGPTTFSRMWLTHKPIGINDSLFWNTDFATGIGLIPTFFVNTGLLGILAWIFFLVLFVRAGIRAIFHSIQDLFSRYLITSSFIASLFLWILSFIYVPTVAIFTLTFFFTGLFAASLYREGLLSRKVVSINHHPKLSFVSVLVLVALVLGSISLGYLIIQKTISYAYFQKSVLGYQKDQSFEVATSRIKKAIELSGEDVYYRGLSELGLVKLDSIVSRPNVTAESVQAEFQQTLADTIENAKKATQINPNDYQNWLSLARVYAALVPQPLAIPGAYENAKATYNEALKVNPHSPALLLFMARLEGSHGDLKLAREFANKAIAEKQNYAEAHFFLAQIEVTEGNLAKAIPSLEKTLLLTPNNPGLFFQLGLLKYSNYDYAGAAAAFNEAIKLVPEYANAKYFFGISLFKIGQKEMAIQQFEDLAKSNPDNKEVPIILANLKAGKDPFANVKPPITNRPEKREDLPLEQNI